MDGVSALHALLGVIHTLTTHNHSNRKRKERRGGRRPHRPYTYTCKNDLDVLHVLTYPVKAHAAAREARP
jgi:hypothetical protein